MERKTQVRVLIVLLISAGVLLVLGANAHLLYVALDSAPGCVTHLKPGEAEPGRYSAAKSAC